MAWFYFVVAIGLVPWIVDLAVTLPRRNLEHHYRATRPGHPVMASIRANTSSVSFGMTSRAPRFS